MNLTPQIDQAYSARVADARAHLAAGKDPLGYWATLPRCGVVIFSTTLNEYPLLTEIIISTGSGGTKQYIVFSCDNTALFKLISPQQTEIRELTDTSLLYLIRTLFAAIGANLMGSEVNLSIPRTHFYHERQELNV